ncbi:beta-1,3-galactosyltransferase 5 isoform X2 [Drosophila ficusphila]|nr:beta-1,3-galactosyltransferase 5 isoform X2 [Drosophila ficusphila]
MKDATLPLTSENQNPYAENPIASIQGHTDEKDHRQDDDISHKEFSMMLLDSKRILAKKSMELLFVETDVPVRMPLVETFYQPGHMKNNIDTERICPQNGVHTKLLVLITSALHHEKARMSIRQTWMHYGVRRDVGMAFVMGQGSNTTIDQSLEQEGFMYGDLIRGHFLDSYDNLTLKTISLLEWADLHCPKAKFVLKTDDDMFINVPKLMSLMETLKANRSIYGCRAENWKPIRNRKSKYHITIAQYAKKIFPYFTTGPAYLITGDIVHDLYIRSLKTPFLKLEDVFTTGIVAESLNIRRVNVREMANTRTKLKVCQVRDRITIHMIQPNEQFQLWKMLLDDTIKCDKN